jgi:hypothetical protein
MVSAEQEQQDAAGHEPPPDARGQRLVEQMLRAGAIAGTRVEPVDEVPAQRHQS